MLNSLPTLNTERYQALPFQQNGQAKFKITAKKVYKPGLACCIHQDILTYYMLVFCDHRLRDQSPLVFGSLGTIALDSKYVVIAPDLMYYNVGEIRYLATDLLRIMSACVPIRVFNFYSAQFGDSWREIE